MKARSKKGSQRVPRVTKMAIGEINRRVRGSRMIYENRDELAAELLSLGTSSIDDIVEFSSEGVRLRERSEISDVSMRAVRRIRVTPGRFGSTVDVEMIDKRQILQMLAKSAGLLDQEKEVDKPSVVSIDMVMPDKGVDDG